MATAILTHDTTNTLADAATAYLQQHTLTDATPAFIARMVATLQHLITVQEDDELEDRDYRYAMLVAAGAEIDFDDVPPALWNEPTPLPDRMAAVARPQRTRRIRTPKGHIDLYAGTSGHEEVISEFIHHVELQARKEAKRLGKRYSPSQFKQTLERAVACLAEELPF